MKSHAVLIVTMVGASGACGSEPPQPLCNPLQAMTGRVAVEQRVAPERLARGAAVIDDNGAHYFFVDAQCNYWVNNPNQVWLETRTGVLDADSALQFGESLHFSAWPDLSGIWSDPAGGVYDAPVMVFDDAKDAVVCAQLCDASDVPVAVKGMRDAFPMVAQELWDRGAPVVSGVRAIAVAGQPGPGIPFVDWPLSRPISDFVRTDESIGFGEGTLEDDTASAQALKELRASFLRGDYGAFVWNMLPVKSDGAYYRVYLRDTLPFEDERGLVPLSIDVD